MQDSLPSGWTWKKFKTILDEPLRNGIYKKKEYHGSGCKIVNMGELFAYPRLKDKINMKRVELNKTELKNSTLQEGDLIFARRSLTAEGAGKCSIILSLDETTTFESSIIRARLNRRIAHPEFYYYFFNSPFGKWLLGTILRQVAVAGITGSDLAQLEVPFPPKDTQDKIAEVGRILDNKIDLNFQINQTLEQIAQAIFKSWFVDFDPVKAKMTVLESGGTKEEAERAAMSAISGKDEDTLNKLKKEQPKAYAELKQTAALFPSAMQDSELGEIPEGWEIGKLSDLIEFNPTRTLKKGTVAPYLDMKNMPTSGHLADNVILREMNSGTKFINGDTLLARITPCLENGKTAFVDFLKDDEVGWGSTEYIVMRPHANIPKSLGYFIARNSTFRMFAIKTMTGSSGRQRADANILANLPWLKYPMNILNEFGKIADKTLIKAKSHGDENKVLTQLRDALLPKLLSGEIKLENLVEANK